MFLKIFASGDRQPRLRNRLPREEVVRYSRISCFVSKDRRVVTVEDQSLTDRKIQAKDQGQSQAGRILDGSGREELASGVTNHVETLLLSAYDEFVVVLIRPDAIDHKNQ